MLDTNVLASGFVGFAHAERTPVRLLRLWQDKRFALVVSAEILYELSSTFTSPYFRQQLTPQQIDAARQLIEEDAQVVAASEDVSGVASHPEDDLILSAAVSAHVDYLVTGDAKLQRIGMHRGVTVVSPRAFLDLLESTGDEVQ
jgi:putative PIN family toxin of toxin-antitoxin system